MTLQRGEESRRTSSRSGWQTWILRHLPYVEDALIERAKPGIFGYSDTQKVYFNAVAGWMERHHHWKIKEDWLIKTPGVVFALAMAVKAFTKAGDSILIQQPVYYPFSEVIRDNDRVIVSNDLILGDDNRYHIDLADFEKADRGT